MRHLCCVFLAFLVLACESNGDLGIGEFLKGAVKETKNALTTYFDKWKARFNDPDTPFYSREEPFPGSDEKWTSRVARKAKAWWKNMWNNKKSEDQKKAIDTEFEVNTEWASRLGPRKAPIPKTPSDIPDYLDYKHFTE